MKKILKIKLVLVLAFLFATTGCKDDFLVEDNPNAISPATFWQDIQDLRYGLIAAYKGMAHHNNYKLVDEISRSDYAWSSGWQRPNNTNEFYLQTFNEASNTVGQKWSQLYTTIFRANQVIAAAERLAGTHGNADTELENSEILAQVRFIRGFAYFNLHNHFNGGSVPIWDEVPTTETGFYKSVSPAEDVRQFYLADLQYAADNLPASWDGPERGKVTAGAAVSVIGLSHLYANDFATASMYFKRVIDDFGYSLTPNIGSNFTTLDELNEESILELVYTLDYKRELNQWDARDTASASGYTMRLTGGPNGWFGGVAANWLIQEYRNDPLDFSDDRNRITLEDGSEGFRKYSLRTSWSVAIADDDDMEYYGSAKTGNGSNFNVKMTCFWRKHTNWDLGFDSERLVEGTDNEVRSGVNERLIRLAEIYLAYAECQIELGNVDEALLYINKVRRRSGVRLLGPIGSGEFPFNDHDNETYDAAKLRDHLRFVEYPLELSCEGRGGDRNIDLRRWGIKKQRFQELSQREYVGTSFQMENDQGVTVWKWGALCDEVGPGEGDVDWAEFTEAAVNYNEASHAYWPLPNPEIVANPDLTNN